MRRRDVPKALVLSSVAASAGLARSAAAQAAAPAHSAQSQAETGAGVKPLDTTFAVGDIRRYGAIGDNSPASASRNAAALTQAVAVAHQGGGEVVIPVGVFCIDSGMILDKQTSSVVVRGVSLMGSVLKKIGNFVGITIAGFARPLLVNFTLDGTGKDSSTGIQVLKAANRAAIRGVVVQNQGKHGIEVVSGNLLTLQDITTVSNGGDGIKFNGASVPDANACTLTGIDSRGNNGWGLNIASAWANFGTGIVTQSNRGGGVQLDNARQNYLEIYAESNSGADILLTANANCVGNFLEVVQGRPTYKGSAGNFNTVLLYARGARFDTNFNKLTADRFVLPSELQDGTEVGGIGTISHTTAARYDYRHSAYDTEAHSVFSHENPAFPHVIDADNVVLKKASGATAAGQVRFGATTAKSAGNGGIAIPTAAGFLVIYIGGTAYKIPYCAD